MYGEFLIKAAPIIKNENLFTLGVKFINTADKWDHISHDMWQLSQTAGVTIPVYFQSFY